MGKNTWKSEPLANLCYINLGNTPSRSRSDFWGKGHSWVSISDLKSKEITNTKEEITDLAIKETNSKLIEKGTLLMSFKLTIGKLAFAGKDLYTNEAIVALPIKDKNKLNADYLYYALNFIPLLGGNQAAMGQTLNKQSLSVLKIPIPPTLDDQKRIAKILSKCDELVQKRVKSISLLEELLNSKFMEMFGDIRTNSKNLPTEKLGNLFGKGMLVDGPFGSAIKVDVDYVDNGTIPIIRTKNIKRFLFSDKDLKFILEEKYSQISRSNVIPGDILISKVGTIGNVCLFPSTYKVAVLSTTGSSRIRNDRDDIDTQYLLYYLDRYKELMINRASDGVLKFLTLGHIRDFNILIPPLVDQLKFSELVAKVTSIKKIYEESLRQLENLFKSVSQSVFHEDLDLSNIDISDMRDLKKNDLEKIEGDLIDEQLDLIDSFEPTLPDGEVPSDRKLDIRQLTIREYLGYPEVDEATEGIEFACMNKDFFYQFILKDGFENRTFTLTELERYARKYILRGSGYEFTYENWKYIVFRFLDAKQPILEQVLAEFMEGEKLTKSIKLQLTDEAFKV
jgi:type I restriction enzyme S subunit